MKALLAAGAGVGGWTGRAPMSESQVGWVERPREGKDPPWEKAETRGESCVVKQAPVLAASVTSIPCVLAPAGPWRVHSPRAPGWRRWGPAMWPELVTQFFTKFPFWPLNLIYGPSKSLWAAVTESPRHIGFQTREHLFLTLLEMENPRSKSWQVRCLVRKPLLVHGRLSSRRVLTGPKGQGSAMRSLGHPFDHDGSILMVLITS